MKPENKAPEKLNSRHEVFIREMIRHNDKVRAYKAAYPGANDESARVAACRLLSHPDIKERLKYAYNSIELGVREDKMAFINQEIKIINVKREMLLHIINGTVKATINERLKAIRLDNELAERQAVLLGYGNLKDIPRLKEPAPQKTEESVTNMNKEAVAADNKINKESPASEGFAQISGHYPYIHPVTNLGAYECISQPAQKMQV